MKQQSTIKEIAEEIGMSTASVSRALSNYPHTSDKTKEKVKEAAQKLGYRYNALAAALRNNKSNAIGLIVPRISMFFQGAVITAIQNKLHAYGYNVIICQSNESPEVEKKLVELLYASRVEGLIVSSSIHTVDFSHFKKTLNGEIPIVFYDRVPMNFQGHKIIGDDFLGAYKATTHLLEQGCKHIVHIGGLLTCSLYQERFKGYKEALKDGNIDFDDRLVYFQELNWSNAFIACKAIFEQEITPDGIFSSNDSTALAVIKFAKENNIRVPEDLKVVGYSNDNRANISYPTLSSVEQFPNEMGKKAAILMMDLLNEKGKYSKNYISQVIPVDLIKRASSTKNI